MRPKSFNLLNPVSIRQRSSERSAGWQLRRVPGYRFAHPGNGTEIAGIFTPVFTPRRSAVTGLVSGDFITESTGSLQPVQVAFSERLLSRTRGQFPDEPMTKAIFAALALGVRGLRGSWMLAFAGSRDNINQHRVTGCSPF
jgi:hypothetical protein